MQTIVQGTFEELPLAFTVCGVFDRVALKALANAGTFTLFHRLRLFLSEGLSLRLRHGGSHVQTKDEKVLDEDSEGSDGNAETEIDCID